MTSQGTVSGMRVMVILAMVLGACAAGSGESDEPTAAPTGAPTDAAPEEGDTITGTLGGDAQLEGGCAWVETPDVRWDVQYPEGYEVSFDPLTLTGPDGQTAGEGDEVTVTGAEDSEVMTTCQVGPVWRATSVTFGGG